MSITAPKFYDPEETLLSLIYTVERVLAEIEQDKFTAARAANVDAFEDIHKRTGALFHHARLTRSLPPPAPIATGPSRGDADDVSPRPFQEAWK